MIEEELDKAIRKLCCSNTRDAKYSDIKRIMVSLGFIEKPGHGSHMKFIRIGYPPLVIASHKPFRPIYLKEFCKYLRENNLWNLEEAL
jgi:hypothetical protein